MPNARSVLELTVNNHPGVMSHVCDLFSRRNYNLEAILCMPVPGTAKSRMWLLMDEDERLDQIVKQATKLVDVLEVRALGAMPTLLEQLGACMEKLAENAQATSVG